MKPYLLKGHERPLTFLKYNRDGDLLFSCAKDGIVTLWYSDDGLRLGTYQGHSGAIYQCDITYDSEFLITASADSTLRIWKVQTGRQLFEIKYREPCRATALSLGEELTVVTTDKFMGRSSSIHILGLARDLVNCEAQDKLTIEVDRYRIMRAFFHDVNRQLITAHEDGSVRRWDTETGKHLETVQLHTKLISDLKLSEDGTHMVTASIDKTSKLVDTGTFQTIKSYQTERPINSVDMSPILEHIVMGGGQSAVQVTKTSARAGKFESIFFHKIFGEQFGSVKGHFGPINAVAFNPDGRSFSTGGEDGYIRLHHFDDDYFSTELV